MGDKTVAEYRAEVKLHVKSSKLNSDAEVDAFVQAALPLYSKRRPRLITKEKTGDGETYAALPSAGDGWETDYSRIMGIESPLDLTPPSYMGDDDWIIQPTPSGDRIKWIGGTYPGDGDLYWVSFTARHSLTADPHASTIPDSDFNGISYLAVSIYARALADFYLGQTTPSLSADTVNHQSKALDANRLSNEMVKRWDKEIPVRPMSVITDWERPFASGDPYLTHEGR